MRFLYIAAAYALPVPTMTDFKARIKTDAMMAGIGAASGGMATKTWYGAAIGAGIMLVTAEATHIFNKWRGPKVQKEAQEKFEEEERINSLLYGGAPATMTANTIPQTSQPLMANSKIQFSDDGTRAYMVDPTGNSAPIEVMPATEGGTAVVTAQPLTNTGGAVGGTAAVTARPLTNTGGAVGGTAQPLTNTGGAVGGTSAVTTQPLANSQMVFSEDGKKAFLVDPTGKSAPIEVSAVN
jgi:hypothetical protein